jgi:hypothetical protein
LTKKVQGNAAPEFTGAGAADSTASPADPHNGKTISNARVRRERLGSRLQSLITNLEDDKRNMAAHIELANMILEELLEE